MKLLQPITIGNKTAPNRLAALPMEANDAAPDGSPSSRTIERYSTLARGGWGVIFIEAVAPSADAKARPQQLMLTRATLPEFQRLTDAIRAANGSAVIIIQLNHAGRYALTPGPAYRHAELDAWPGLPPDAPLLTDSELDGISNSMAELALLAGETGVDGADFKCCHGYLGIELLRPANNRPGSWGGAFENRSRYLSTMLDAAAPLIQKGFLAGSRISFFEDIAGGMGDAPPPGGVDAELSATLSLLQDKGACWVCETAGNPYHNVQFVRPDHREKEKFNIAARRRATAAAVKKAFPGLTLIGAGYSVFGKDFAAQAESALERGETDIIGLGRQNFADPDTPRKLLNGDAASINICSACAKKGCAWMMRNGAEAGCVVHSDYYRGLKKELKARLKNQ